MNVPIAAILVDTFNQDNTNEFYFTIKGDIYTYELFFSNSSPNL